MKSKELEKLTSSELKKKLTDLRGQLFVVRFEIQAGKKTNFSEIQKKRRDIARILTLLNSQNNSAPKSKKENIVKSLAHKTLSK